jgi:radical SAM-linked protein
MNNDNSTRIRFTYSKRDRSCFIPHVVIPQIFYRAMRRAGLKPLMSQGFSPRPRITLGPALPVGIVGMCEPAEVWFSDLVSDLCELMNPCLPPGFMLSESAPVEGPSLNKQCKAASYRIYVRDKSKIQDLYTLLMQPSRFRDAILECRTDTDSVELTVADPCGIGPGIIIKYLQENTIIRKWSEICIVRSMVGGWDGSSILPLVVTEDR